MASGAHTACPWDGVPLLHWGNHVATARRQHSTASRLRRNPGSFTASELGHPRWSGAGAPGQGRLLRGRTFLLSPSAAATVLEGFDFPLQDGAATFAGASKELSEDDHPESVLGNTLEPESKSTHSSSFSARISSSSWVIFTRTSVMAAFLLWTRLRRSALRLW